MDECVRSNGGMILTGENRYAGRRNCPVARGQSVTWVQEPGVPIFTVAQSALHPQ